MKGVPSRGQPARSGCPQAVSPDCPDGCLPPVGGRTSPRLLFQVVDEEPPLNLGRSRSAEGDCWVPFRCVGLMC